MADAAKSDGRLEHIFCDGRWIFDGREPLFQKLQLRQHLSQRRGPLNWLYNQAVIIPVDDHLVRGKLEVPRNPKRLVAPVSKQACVAPWRTLSAFTVQHMA